MPHLKLTDCFDTINPNKYLHGKKISHISSIIYSIEDKNDSFVTLVFKGSTYLPSWADQEETEAVGISWELPLGVNLAQYLKEITEITMDKILEMPFPRKGQTVEMYIDKYFKQLDALQNQFLTEVKFRPELNTIELQFSLTKVRVDLDLFISDDNYAKHRSAVQAFYNNTTREKLLKYFKSASGFLESF